MKKNKLTGIILAAVMLIQYPAGAAEGIDYSDKLSELESLLNECQLMNIPTDYEYVNYTVIKRFEDLINEDIKNGHPAADTNIGYMDELYEETKTALEGYISGETKPKTVYRPDMMKTEAEESVVYSDFQPVFSVGYGHFGMAQKDIEKFSDLGMTNIQLEIGPTNLVPDFYGWSEQIMGNADAKAQRELVNGDYAMHITNNSETAQNLYVRYYREIECKPNTEYKFGCSVKGTGLENVWVTINDYADRNDLSSSAYWKNQDFSYTTGEEQTKLIFSVCSEGITDGYLDDFYVYEASEDNKNLVTNGDLEDDDCYSVSTSYITNTLKKAEENNVGVCLLLSPHYFPTDIDADIYNKDADGFFKYNVNAPEAKAVIEDYLDILLPRVVGYKSLDSICISNEPTFSTMDYYNYYNPLFREYLKTVHGSIDVLNQKYGTEFEDFSELNMPTNLKAYDAICYDWIEFNDKTFTDWHKWMADIVKNYLPNIPVHSKMMGYFATGAEDVNRKKLMQGTDLEYFDTFSDYAGNDTWDFMSDINLYYNTMFLYDYQRSVTKKPVYNSEDHIIEDRSNDFSINQRKHLRNNLLMGAVHGRSMSTVWVWDKSTDTSSSLYNSIAYRPDVAAEAGRTSLDLMKYSYDIARLQQEQPKVALFYSKPSRLYNGDYSQKLLWSYISLLNMGVKVGIVSDNSIDLLNDYEVLVIPDATNCTQNTLKAVEKFITDGKKVLYTGDVFAKDEYNNSLDNSSIVENGYKYESDTLKMTDDELYTRISNCGLARLYLVDESTGARASDIDWQYSIENGNILIAISNLEYDDTKNLTLYLDGEKVSDLKEYFTEQTGLDSIVLEGYTPQLLEIKIPKKLTQEIESISVDKGNSLIKWDFRTDNIFGANVYSVSSDGKKTFLQTVKGNEYNYPKSGTYVVSALDTGMFETDGRIVTVTEDIPFEISCIGTDISEKGVSAEIKIKNLKTSICTGVVCIYAYNAADEVVGYSYNKTTVYPETDETFSVMFTTDEAAERVEVYAVDSVLSKNIYSNIITE